ncbi:MAG TPA: carboxymuconolactone decarboxylase family protein [Gemmatimonadaceae bacterium]|nr:carboxymuconolactone decarboxylase family protein [Gemmatimonadaceae bacterium]
MTTGAEARTNLAPLEAGLRHLVRIAGAIAGSPEGQMRATMSDAVDEVDPVAVEEIILQSYLFAGFPRALNAARAWRTVSSREAPEADENATVDDLELWREQGEETCRIVYGEMYEKLRENIRALHPALDEWMIIDGYGKVLSRPYLDLRTRELCVVAACATSGQQRQLHSHLHGALNAGSNATELGAVLDALNDLIHRDDLVRYKQLLGKVVAA